MSIATELTSLTGNIVNAYQACTSKGATIPANKNMNNLASCINSIPTDGGGGGPTGTGDYLIEFIDYDGTLLKSEYHDTGDVVTLPAGPTNHPRLVFQEWSSPVQITNNTITVTDHDIIIGAVYGTVSGKTEIDIELTEGTGLTVSFSMIDNNSEALKSWGDGTQDTATTHTYIDYGKYTITCNGSSFGNSDIFNQEQYKPNIYVRRIFLGNNVTSFGYRLRFCAGLEEITLSKFVSTLSNVDYQFNSCYILKCVVFPYNATRLGRAKFNSCYSLKNVVVGVNASLANQWFSYCYSLKAFIFPQKWGSGEATSMFSDCCSLEKVVTTNSSTILHSYSGSYSLKKVNIPSNITDIPNNCFRHCYGLPTIQIPSSVITIGTYAFQNCRQFDVIEIPSKVTILNNSTFNGCYSLKIIRILSDLNSIASSTFSGCYALEQLDLSHCTAVPTLANTNAFSNTPTTLQILVPSALYEDWKVATNWSTYASRLVAV